MMRGKHRKLGSVWSVDERSWWRQWAFSLKIWMFNTCNVSWEMDIYWTSVLLKGWKMTAHVIVTHVTFRGCKAHGNFGVHFEPWEWLLRRSSAVLAILLAEIAFQRFLITSFANNVTICSQTLQSHGIDKVKSRPQEIRSCLSLALTRCVCSSSSSKVCAHYPVSF